MLVLKFSLCFLICIILFVNIEISSAKRGCSAFGHTCFGGHGKRSQGMEILSPGIDADKEAIRQYPEVPDSALNEQFSSIYDVLEKPENDAKILLKKLIKFYEDQRLHKKYMSKYFNY